MELLGSILVWSLNFFFSGKAKALGAALVGVFISVIVYFVLNVFAQFVLLLSPEFQLWVSENLILLFVGFAVVSAIPAIIGINMCINELHFIENKELYR